MAETPRQLRQRRPRPEAPSPSPGAEGDPATAERPAKTPRKRKGARSSPEAGRGSPGGGGGGGGGSSGGEDGDVPPRKRLQAVQVCPIRGIYAVRTGGRGPPRYTHCRVAAQDDVLAELDGSMRDDGPVDAPLPMIKICNKTSACAMFPPLDLGLDPDLKFCEHVEACRHAREPDESAVLEAPAFTALHKHFLPGGMWCLPVMRESVVEAAVGAAEKAAEAGTNVAVRLNDVSFLHDQDKTTIIYSAFHALEDDEPPFDRRWVKLEVSFEEDGSPKFSGRCECGCRGVACVHAFFALVLYFHEVSLNLLDDKQPKVEAAADAAAAREAARVKRFSAVASECYDGCVEETIDFMCAHRKFPSELDYTAAVEKVRAFLGAAGPHITVRPEEVDCPCCGHVLVEELRATSARIVDMYRIVEKVTVFVRKCSECRIVFR